MLTFHMEYAYKHLPHSYLIQRDLVQLEHVIYVVSCCASIPSFYNSLRMAPGAKTFRSLILVMKCISLSELDG